MELTHNELAALIRSNKSNIWATYDSIQDVIEVSSDSASVMIAVNTTLELIAQLVERDGSTSYDEQEREAHEKGGDE